MASSSTSFLKNYFAVLDLPVETPTNEKLHHAYRKNALKWHPDKNHSKEAAERFKEINEAYVELQKEDILKKVIDLYGIKKPRLSPTEKIITAIDYALNKVITATRPRALGTNSFDGPSIPTITIEDYLKLFTHTLRTALQAKRSSKEIYLSSIKTALCIKYSLAANATKILEEMEKEKKCVEMYWDRPILEPATFIMMCIMVDKYRQKATHPIDGYNIHRILATCLFIANKFINDDCMPIVSSFARIPKKELFQLEKILLETINYDLHYPTSLYRQTDADLLINFELATEGQENIPAETKLPEIKSFMSPIKNKTLVSIFNKQSHTRQIASQVDALPNINSPKIKLS